MGGGLGVDPESEVVDGDVVVVPTERDEVVGVVVAAVGSLPDVVGLEAVLAVTAFDRAVSLVSPGDETPDRRGDRFSHIRIGDGVEAVGDDYSDLAGAEDLGEGVGTDPGTRRDGGAGLSERLGGQGGVDEHFRHRHRPPRLGAFRTCR